MDGIKRIEEMATGQKDYVLLEIVKYLISREDMDEKYLNQEKTLKEMAVYIQGEIMKEFCEKMNTKNPASFAQEVKYERKSTRCLAIGMSREKTFELAIKYFSKSNEDLGIKSEEIRKKETPENKEELDEFGSIFASEKVVQKVKKKEEIEQISLFEM